MIKANFHTESEFYILDERHSCHHCNDFEFCAGRSGWSRGMWLDCGRCNCVRFNNDDTALMAEREKKRKKRK
ncbi:MAG: hypothetical protein SNF68_04465 [Rikenellaceae bacterium]